MICAVCGHLKEFAGHTHVITYGNFEWDGGPGKHDFVPLKEGQEEAVQVQRKYGDVVLLVIGDQDIPGFVLQSLVHPVEIGQGEYLKDDDGDLISEEHLTVAYPEPPAKAGAAQILSGQQVQGAVKFLYSVRPWKEGRHIGFRDNYVTEFIRKYDGELPQATADDTKAKFEVNDTVLGCKVGVELDHNGVAVFIGARDHHWNYGGEHSSGLVLGEPYPVVPDQLGKNPNARVPLSIPIPPGVNVDDLPVGTGPMYPEVGDSVPGGPVIPASAEAPAHIPATAEEVHAGEHHKSFGEKLKDVAKEIANDAGEAAGEAFSSR